MSNMNMSNVVNVLNNIYSVAITKKSLSHLDFLCFTKFINVLLGGCPIIMSKSLVRL